jgi:integrase/recombinase XerD
MDDLISRFLLHMRDERNMSANTTAAYRTDLEQFAQFLAERGISAVEQIDDSVLMDFLLTLRERNYANSTVARRLAAAKSFFAYLLEIGAIPSDPTRDLDSPRVDRFPPRAISQQQVDALLEMPLRSRSPEGMRDRAMLELLYATGLRVSELVALNLDDVDLVQGTVRCRGRNGRERVLPLNPSAVTAIEEYLDNARSALDRAVSDNGYPLFLNHRGQRLTRQGFWLILKGYAEKVGLSELTPHMLRHSFATHQLHSGVDLRELQERLGHASLSTTQIYAQVAQPRNDAFGTDAASID